MSGKGNPVRDRLERMDKLQIMDTLINASKEFLPSTSDFTPVIPAEEVQIPPPPSSSYNWVIEDDIPEFEDSGESALEDPGEDSADGVDDTGLDPIDPPDDEGCLEEASAFVRESEGEISRAAKQIVDPPPPRRGDVFPFNLNYPAPDMVAALLYWINQHGGSQYGISPIESGVIHIRRDPFCRGESYCAGIANPCAVSRAKTPDKPTPEHKERRKFHLGVDQKIKDMVEAFTTGVRIPHRRHPEKSIIYTTRRQGFDSSQIAEYVNKNPRTSFKEIITGLISSKEELRLLRSLYDLDNAEPL